MNSEDFELLFRRLSLGPIQETPLPVKGGLLHKMWKVRGGNCLFAVKELDPKIVSKPGIRKAYHKSEIIAIHMKKSGLFVPKVIMNSGQILHPAGSASVIVYEWIEGKTFQNSKVDSRQANLIGKALAKIHKAGASIKKLNGKPGPPLSGIAWKDFVKRVRRVSPRLSQNLRRFEPQLRAWCVQIDDLPVPKHSNLVLSHRDLDRKNVIWKKGKPIIIDWESAGPIEPSSELVGTALDWSGLDRGRVFLSIFRDFLQAYRRAGGRLVFPPEQALLASLRPRMEWLVANLQKSIGTSDSGRRRGLNEAAKSVRQLRYLALKWPPLIREIEKGAKTS